MRIAGLLALWTLTVAVAAALAYDERDCDPDDVDGCLAARATDEWWLGLGAIGIWLFGVVLLLGGWSALRKK